jgi:hypothetical protein
MFQLVIWDVPSVGVCFLDVATSGLGCCKRLFGMFVMLGMICDVATGNLARGGGSESDQDCVCCIRN